MRSLGVCVFFAPPSLCSVIILLFYIVILCSPNLEASSSDSSSIDAHTLLPDEDIGINPHGSLRVDPSAEFNNETDVFVLGFQELDLSTEALIYSTGTVREDAWCSAVFAALGEKGERYEKVTFYQPSGLNQ